MLERLALFLRGSPEVLGSPVSVKDVSDDIEIIAMVLEVPCIYGKCQYIVLLHYTFHSFAEGCHRNAPCMPLVECTRS